MNKYEAMTEEGKSRQRQLFQDIIPYYGRISVYDMDKAFIDGHLEECVRMAMAGRLCCHIPTSSQRMPSIQTRYLHS